MVRTKNKEIRESYKRITWLLESQVTWNQVQGLTRVGSQLCRTLVASLNLLLKACKAFPEIKLNHKSKWQNDRISKLPNKEGMEKKLEAEIDVGFEEIFPDSPLWFLSNQKETNPVEEKRENLKPRKDLARWVGRKYLQSSWRRQERYITGRWERKILWREAP